MRLALLAAVTTAAGLGACAPLPGDASYGYGYGYSTVEPVAAAPYGYYDGGYAPQPYYGGPVYGRSYVTPGPAIIVGGGGRFRDDDRYRYRNDRGRNEGYRGAPRQNFDRGERPAISGGGGGRPGPAPVAAPRPAPPVQGPPPGGGGHAPDFNPANPTAHGDRG